MHQVTVRYFAAARAAAGVREEAVDVPDGGTVGQVLARVLEQHGEGLSRVLERSSLLLDAALVRDPMKATGPGSTLDILPPFAGG